MREFQITKLQTCQSEQTFVTPYNNTVCIIGYVKMTGHGEKMRNFRLNCSSGRSEHILTLRNLFPIFRATHVIYRTEARGKLGCVCTLKIIQP